MHQIVQQMTNFSLILLAAVKEIQSSDLFDSMKSIRILRQFSKVRFVKKKKKWKKSFLLLVNQESWVARALA